MDSDIHKNLRKIVKELCSNQPENVMKAVKCLRHKYLKRNCENSMVKIFCDVDGVKMLTSLLFAAHKEQLFDYILSILANCCVENEEARKQIVNANGVKAVGRILNGLEKQSIQDRACRLLGNLSKDNISHASILNNKSIIVFIVDYLKSSVKSNNEDSIKGAIRTLRYIAMVSPECSLELVNQRILAELVQLIKTSQFGIYEPVLSLLSNISDSTVEAAFHQQVVSSGLLPIIVKFTSHKSTRLRHLSLSFIVNLCTYTAEHVGSAGGVPIIIDAINNMSTHSIKKSELIETLCSFLYHANNRSRMNRYKGFECLMKLLCSGDGGDQDSDKEEESGECSSNDNHKEVIIKALLQCLYDDVSMATLQELNIVPRLLDQLDKFIEKHHGPHLLSENNSRNKIDLSVFDVCAEDIKSLMQSSDAHNGSSINQQESSNDDDRIGEQTKEEYSVNSPSYQMILVNQGEVPEEQSSASNMSYGLSAAQLGFSPSSNSLSPCISPSSGEYSPLGCTSPVSPSSPLSIASDMSACLDDIQDLLYSDHEQEELMQDMPNSNSAIKVPRKRKLTSDFKNWRKQRRKSSMDSKVNIEATTPSVKQRKSREELGPTSDQKLMDAIFTILAKYTWKVDGRRQQTPACVTDHMTRYFKVFLSFVTNVPMERTTKMYGHAVRPFYSACKTLCRIASDLECLGRMVTCDIPRMVQRASQALQHGDDTCEQCYIIRRFCRKILERDLRAVAESRVGQGRLQELMATSTEHKVKVAQVLPCLLTSRKLVHKFYLHLELISHLLNALAEDPQKEEFSDSVLSVVMLSRMLGMKSMMSGCGRGDEDRLPVKCVYNEDDASSDVWFVLADGDRVGASKAALMSADFFRAMFCGNFSETEQSSISVEDAGVEAFCLMMHYLHCSSVPCDGSVDLMFDCGVVLQLLHLADRYLLKDLQYSLHDQIINNMTADNAANVYSAASLIQDDYLAESTLRFVLAGNISIAARIKCVQNLMASQFKTLVLHHIEKLLRDQMNL